MPKNIWNLILISALTLTLASCATAPRHAMQGTASWYGKSLQGQKTASGERFDMHALTAAHRTLAFGSMVRVTSATSHKSVVVRINDRGPHALGRIIDLSYEAARQIGLIEKGEDVVTLEKL